jgi:hypothetical protein
MKSEKRQEEREAYGLELVVAMAARKVEQDAAKAAAMREAKLLGRDDATPKEETESTAERFRAVRKEAETIQVANGGDSIIVSPRA